jgi:hypothetical protein
MQENIQQAFLIAHMPAKPIQVKPASKISAVLMYLAAKSNSQSHQ